MSVHPENTASLQAHPNVTQAAEMLGVSASTISRRGDLVKEMRGERDVVLAPSEVLRLARIYRKRSINDVAQALLERAGESEPGEQIRVQEEIETFFEAHTVADEREELRRLARRLLPAALAREVEEGLDQPARELPDQIEGFVPAGEQD